MKTLDDVKSEMSNLYDSFKSGSMKREDVAELANVAGKYLKAEQLQIARAMLEIQINPGARTISQRKPRQRQLQNAA